MEATENGHEHEELFQKKNNRLSPEELFTLFVEATDCQEILQIFQNVRNILQIKENGDKEAYSKIKSKLTSWKCQSLWDLIDAKAKHVEYGKGAICNHVNVLIIGAGPIGLRTAIETALLGCRTVIVEKRKSFSRNNVLHLWPFLLTDFRSFGAKKFYGKFCAGAIDHISIKRLQGILFKVCLILGVEIYTGIEFKGLIEPTNDRGWRAQCSPHVKQFDEFDFDVVVGADGKKDMLPGFPQIEMRGALAIGITCNFVNENTVAEAGVEEISGIAYQFNPKFFDDLREQFDVGLENIVYYKDETHYFVMTAMKSSLLKRGVFKQDFSDPTKLLEKQNVDLDQLIQYTLDTVHYATKYNLPTDIKLVQNPNGTPDIAVFDFTSLKKSASASKLMERKGKRLLMALVGDSLLQPFWPTGSGCGRGVLSALDAAWMIRLFGMKMSPLAVLRERENIFKLLPATDSSHLQKNYKAFTINPATRYSNLNQVASVNVAFLKKLYDTDDPENADYSLPEPVVSSRFEIGRAATVQPHKARKKSLAKRRVNSTSAHKRRSDRTTLRDAKHVSNKMAMWEDKIPKNAQPGGPSKKTKPSHSGSGSCLESVSESEHEEIANGPYQRAMTLRNRKQSGDTLSDVFTGSSAEELDRMDDDDTHLLAEKQSNVQGSASTVPHPDENAKDHHQYGDGRKHHKGGVIRRLLGRGRGDHDGERRKSVAARKSLSKARRMRRKSGTGSRSSQSQPEDKEITTLLPKDGHGSITVRKKHSKIKVTEGQDSTTFKVPAVPAEDKVKKSAKELIAAAEARQAKEGKHGAKKNETLKRKADEIGEDTKTSRYENVPWNHHLPAVEPLLPPENNKENEEHSVKHASQLAGLVLLAVPLLLPCRVRLVGKPSSMLAEKRNTLLRSSTEKKETRKISMTRAGSVQKAVAQYKTKLEQDTSSDFAEFKRNRNSGRFNRDSFTGKISPYQGNSMDEPRTTSGGSAVDTDDYDIIEMKSNSLQAKEYLRIEDDFDVISGSEVKMDKTDLLDAKKAKKMTKKKTVKRKAGEIFKDLLSQLCREERLTSVQITLEILHGIHKSITKNSNVDKYYRIYTKGRDFETYVWKSETCRAFLLQVGWQICGSFVVLSKSTNVQEPLRCIEEAQRDVEQLLRNRSHSSKKSPTIETQKAGIANGDSTGFIYKNKESQNIKGKFPIAKELTDGSQSGLSNANASGKEGLDLLIDSLDETYVDPSSEEEDQLESSEGYIGDEEYLIVDFTTKGNTNRGVAIMGDDVYNKDGRRRRRKTLEEHDKKKITEDVQPERVSLRRRLKDGQEGKIGGRVDGSERERRDKGSSQRREPRKDVIGQEDEDLYDKTGRRRRRRSGGREGGRPPSNDSSSRRSEESRASETTATLSKAATSESDSRSNKETKSRVMDQVYLSENRPIKADGSTEVDGNDEENSKGVGLSRLEVLQRESDSSGSETGKKKKLVLKRGSMRRKRLQENAKKESENDSDNSKQKVSENNTKKEVTVTKGSSVHSKNHDVIESKVIINVEDVCVTESIVDAPNVAPGSEQTKNSEYLQKEAQVQEVVKGNKVQQFSVSSGCKESQMADLATGLGNLNVVDEGENVSIDIGHTESNMTEHKECAKNVDLQLEDNGKEIEVKKEKKRKLVLKVKRKKNKESAVNNELKDNFVEAPVVSRDKDPRVHSIEKNGLDNDKKVQVERNGEKTAGEPIKVETEGPSVKDLLKRMEARGKHDNGLIRNGSRNGRHETEHVKTKKLDLVEKFEKPGGSNGPVKTLELDKFEKQGQQGSSNGAVKKLDLDKFERQGDSRGANKKLELEKQEGINGPVKTLESGDDIGLVGNGKHGKELELESKVDINENGDDAGKPKKKKFVLKRKKKGTN